MLDTMHGAHFETMVINKASATGKSEQFIDWNNATSEEILNGIDKLQIVLQENEYRPAIEGPEKLLIAAGVLPSSLDRRYMIPEAIEPKQNNKTYYNNDNRRYKSKKSRRGL